MFNEHQKEYKESHTYAHHVKLQKAKDRESYKSNKRKMTHYVQGDNDT